jgi:TetR/AcrR family transcriptional regulator, regulator of autoinduction and epiphytic fitness
LGLEKYRRSVSEAKRASILRAGRENFLKNGYSGAAVVDIARSADVSTATLYKHFSSKEVLFAAVVTDAYVADDHPDTPHGTDIEEFFVELISRYLRLQYDRQLNALVRIVIAEVPSAPKLAHDLFEKFIGARYRAIEGTISQLIAAGKLKLHDEHYGARFIAGPVREYFVWPALFDADAALPEGTDVVVRRVVRDYLKLYGV